MRAPRRAKQVQSMMRGARLTHMASTKTPKQRVPSWHFMALAVGAGLARVHLHGARAGLTRRGWRPRSQSARRHRGARCAEFLARSGRHPRATSRPTPASPRRQRHSQPTRPRRSLSLDRFAEPSLHRAHTSEGCKAGCYNIYGYGRRCGVKGGTRGVRGSVNDHIGRFRLALIAA